jgi:galactokinase
MRENKRVLAAKDALKKKDVSSFFSEILASGHSSFEYLQNVYTVKAVDDQGLSLALALTDGFMQTHDGAFRVHGGGFAGTILAFVKAEDVEDYVKTMDGVLGDGATMRLRVRPHGAIRLLG